MPVPRASVNQQAQVGVEVTPGVPVAATKLLTAFIWTLGLKPVTKQFRGTGRQYPSASALLTEMSGGKISGPGDFAQGAYPVSSLWGTGNPVLHAGSVAAYDYKWTPPIVGSYAANAKAFTVQVGDASDAEQYAFLVATSFGYSFGRKQEVQFDADLIAQTFTEGITLTPAPTFVEQVPMTGAQMNVYLDVVSANLGSTLLTDPLKVDYKASGYYDPYFPVNRANASYTSIVDKEKKHELKLNLQANSTGIAVKGQYLDTGARCYVRVSGVGQLIENDQTVGVGAASAGTYTLSYKGQVTTPIAYNATAAVVQSALRALSTIGATGCSVSGTAPTWTVTMTGALALDMTALIINGAGLTGGTPLVTAAPVYAAMTHDMACFVADMAEFSDVDGVYAVEYTLAVAEDSAWGTAPGTAQIFSFTNLLPGL